MAPAGGVLKRPAKRFAPAKRAPAGSRIETRAGSRIETRTLPGIPSGFQMSNFIHQNRSPAPVPSDVKKWSYEDDGG